MELLQNVKKGIADVVTSKKRLQLQQQKLEQQVVKLDTQARQALAAGKEDLARTALERKQFAQGELQSLDQQVAELERVGGPASCGTWWHAMQWPLSGRTKSSSPCWDWASAGDAMPAVAHIASAASLGAIS